MADPISIAAVAALVYAGKVLSKKEQEAPKFVPKNPVPKPNTMIEVEETDDDFDFKYGASKGLESLEYQNKQEMPSFGEVAPQRRTSGGEILDMRDRLYDQGRMNNLSPVEKQMVGPGLGVSADVPAVGGFQQLYRVMPTNVGEYKLTQLPGRTNHGADTMGGRRGIVGEVAKNRPERTTDLDARLPVARGRAQGMSAITPRQEHEKTKRTTNRAETGLRTDGLQNTPAKRFTSAMTIAQEPTRNKTDLNDGMFAHMDNPQPGIHSFYGAYENSAAVQASASRDDNAALMRYGFRPEDRRGQANRMPNRGRMNVRESPVKQGGQLTSVRMDQTRVDGRVNPMNGAWMQQYKNADYHQFNPYKGKENPYATPESLNTTRKQLANNPFAQQSFC
jgi:hypothetical protein